MDYKILLEIKGVYNESYTEENISLGTSIKETLDKSYDVASLELLLTDIKEEFQPYTPVILYLYDKDDSIDKLDANVYHMIIESDTVEDVYIGTRVRYTHKLTLIEETKLLETEMMPNISFTQPVKNISPESGIDFIEPKYMDYVGLTHKVPEQKIIKKIYPGAKLPNIPLVINFATETFSFLLSVVGPLLYQIIASIVEMSDGTPTVSIYPKSVILRNDKNTYEMANPVYKEKESADRHLGKALLRARVKEDTSDWFYVPNDIEEGTYDVIYQYGLEGMDYRDLTWWPFSSPWKPLEVEASPTSRMPGARIADLIVVLIVSAISAECYTLGFILGYSLGLDAAAKQLRGTLADIVNGGCLVLYQGLEYSTDADRIVQSEPIMLSKVMENVQSQITVGERFNLASINKLTTTSPSINNILTDIIFLPDGKGRFFSLRDHTTIIPYDENVIDLKSYIDYTFSFLDENENVITIQNLRKELPPLNSKTIHIDLEIPDGIRYLQISRHSERHDTSRLDIDFYLKSDPKYTFSDAAISMAYNIISPEYTFEKKSLWEICLEIGEVFNGIPVLREGVIDYLFLDSIKKDTPEINMENKQRTSNMTNYATKLYTDELTNIIQDNGEDISPYCIYPSPNGWVKARAADYAETAINRESSAIVIDNEKTGIYKLRKVLCKYKDVEYNITDQVLEKDIFDSLSTAIDPSLFGNAYSVSEKGTKAYYERGKNAIMNIAQLPENGSVIGWKQTHLTIQFILYHKFNIPFEESSKNIFDYEFRVEYYPYHSRLNIARQSNLNGIYNQVTNNFNQNSNNVSSTQFAKHTQEILNKLGNAEITTQYTSNQILDPISIGNCLVIDDKNYYVNDKITTYNNNDKTVLLNLTKDNYKQNNRIAVSREYRQYNIDSRNIVRKTISKPLSIFVSTDEIKLKSDSTYKPNSKSSNRRTIAKSIVDTLRKNTSKAIRPITNSFIHPENKDGSVLQYNTFRADVTPSTCANKIIPINGNVIGNTLTFQWDMYDNFSAGRTCHNPTEMTDNWWNNLEIKIGDLTLKEKDYGIKIQNDARYCGDNGETPMIYTELFANNEYIMPPVLSSTLPDTTIGREGIKHYIENSLSFEFEANKDSREALSFQTTISAQTFDKDIKIHNLLKYNPLLIESDKGMPSWYGYTSNDLPSTYQIYRYNENNKLKFFSIQTTDTSYGSTVVKIQIQNSANNVFAGYVLCYDNGEILLDIRKELPLMGWASVYFNIFDDEINLKDIEYNVRETKYLDIESYSPGIYCANNKVYSYPNLIKQDLGLDFNEVEFVIATKHNTIPRGIQGGYHGRRYAKHKKGDSLIITGNNWEYGDKVFSKILMLEDGEIVFKDPTDGAYVNIYDYLMSKKISKQDLSDNKVHSHLSYFFRLKYDGRYSLTSEIIDAEFNPDSREPMELYF